MTVRLFSVAAAAVVSITTPYQEPGLVDTPRSDTGETTVPFTVSVPRTISSTRPGSVPAA